MVCFGECCNILNWLVSKYHCNHTLNSKYNLFQTKTISRCTPWIQKICLDSILKLYLLHLLTKQCCNIHEVLKWLKNCEKGNQQDCRYENLTFLLKMPEYSAITKSVKWLLMFRILTLPGHQQPWYWICRINGHCHPLDRISIDPSLTSYNTPVPYTTIHHLVTEMCTRVHISVTTWCIVRYLMHCGIC